jgi:hypothetical protein
MRLRHGEDGEKSMSTFPKGLTVVAVTLTLMPINCAAQITAEQLRSRVGGSASTLVDHLLLGHFEHAVANNRGSGGPCPGRSSDEAYCVKWSLNLLQVSPEYPLISLQGIKNNTLSGDESQQAAAADEEDIVNLVKAFRDSMMQTLVESLMLAWQDSVNRFGTVQGRVDKLEASLPLQTEERVATKLVGKIADLERRVKQLEASNAK